jgi:prepilin-type processing-associated H-X9-DG protein
LNGWLYQFSGSPEFGAAADPPGLFLKPSNIKVTTLTPVFFDEVWVDTWPLSTKNIQADIPARNLYTGDFTTGGPGINRETIPRHGSKAPGSAPRNWPPGVALPGAINMSFADGHAQLVNIQNLWSFYWSLDWAPPSTRPP